MNLIQRNGKLFTCYVKFLNSSRLGVLVSSIYLGIIKGSDIEIALFFLDGWLQ